MYSMSRTRLYTLVTLAVLMIIGIIGAVILVVSPSVAGRAIVAVSPVSGKVNDDLLKGRAPEMSTIVDKEGNPIAYLYDQRREIVGFDDISQNMKDAILSIEDRRFYEHEGVDVQGILRALVENIRNGEITGGASTIEQQYVKNYQMFDPSTEEDASSRTYTRKLIEAALAVQLNGSTSKDDILAFYLNTIPYGNGSFGIEDAARTYFNVSARDLTVEQSALLAGIIQSPSSLDPYTNYDGALDRRNIVLSTMVDTGKITEEQRRDLSALPLGVTETPTIRPTGCAAAGGAGHFCDFVRSWLNDHDITDAGTAGYTITTTLDPVVQSSMENSMTTLIGNPTGVAEVTAVITPGTDSRHVVAMASSRPYGLGGDQTTQPITYSNVGHGAGSIFKVFAAAAAIEDGLNPDVKVKVPTRVEARGLGDGGASGCPTGAWCVENVGNYPSEMTLRDALAQSPNTPFVKLMESTGVKATVDMSVRLGLRSYEDNGVAERAIAGNQGSYVLGASSVSVLELANVGATLASSGTWCEPTPVSKIVDRDGNDVELPATKCDDAVPPAVADTLSEAMSDDTTKGTAATAASTYGWSGNMAAKTGTTDDHMSAAFMGYTAGFSSAVLAFNDGTSASPLCAAPLRQCSYGDLYGGTDPANTFFAGLAPIADHFPGGRELPDSGVEFSSADDELKQVIGMKKDDARKFLTEKGWTNISTSTGYGDSFEPGQVVRVRGSVAMRSAPITLVIHDDNARPEPTTTQAPEPAPTQQPAPVPAPVPAPAPQCPVINIPFIGDVRVC